MAAVNQHSQTWSTSVWSLLQSPKYSLLALVCPAVAYFSASKTFEEKPSSLCESLLGGYLCCIGFRLRTRFRESNGIPGSQCSDLCSHCLCNSLAIAHVWLEAKARRLPQRSGAEGNRQHDDCNNQGVIYVSAGDIRLHQRLDPPGPSRMHHECPSRQTMERPVQVKEVERPRVMTSQSVVDELDGELEYWDELDREEKVGVTSFEVEQKYETYRIEKKQEDSLRYMTAGAPIKSVLRSSSQESSHLKERYDKCRESLGRLPDLTDTHEIKFRSESSEMKFNQTAYELAQADVDGSLGDQYAVDKSLFGQRRSNTDMRKSMAEYVDLIVSFAGSALGAPSSMSTRRTNEDASTFSGGDTDDN